MERPTGWESGSSAEIIIFANHLSHQALPQSSPEAHETSDVDVNLALRWFRPSSGAPKNHSELFALTGIVRSGMSGDRGRGSFHQRQVRA